MLVSFIMTSLSREDKIFKTINSLKKQNNQSFELILLNDNPSLEKEALDFFKDQFKENEQMTLILNSKATGNSNNWNTAIAMAKGKYFALIKEGDIVDPTFVEEVKLIDATHGEIDVIEVMVEGNGLSQGVSETNLTTNKVYNLPNEKEVFAYVGQVIYGKLFRTDYVKDFRLTFRKNTRYDLLFIYKALGHARTFLVTDKVLLKHRFSILKYTTFDLVNQWPHILNYFRRIGLYKELKDELIYAQYLHLSYTFLNLVKQFENPTLYKKSLKYIGQKLLPKADNFINKNPIFLEQKDEKFSKRIVTLETFINSELKNTKSK